VRGRLPREVSAQTVTVILDRAQGEEPLRAVELLTN
jgi:hypothetical protein